MYHVPFTIVLPPPGSHESGRQGHFSTPHVRKIPTGSSSRRGTQSGERLVRHWAARARSPLPAGAGIEAVFKHVARHRRGFVHGANSREARTCRPGAVLYASEYDNYSKYGRRHRLRRQLSTPPLDRPGWRLSLSPSGADGGHVQWSPASDADMCYRPRHTLRNDLLAARSQRCHHSLPLPQVACQQNIQRHYEEDNVT